MPSVEGLETAIAEAKDDNRVATFAEIPVYHYFTYGQVPPADKPILYYKLSTAKFDNVLRLRKENVILTGKPTFLIGGTFTLLEVAPYTLSVSLPAPKQVQIQPYIINEALLQKLGACSIPTYFTTGKQLDITEHVYETLVQFMLELPEYNNGFARVSEDLYLISAKGLHEFFPPSKISNPNTPYTSRFIKTTEDTVTFYIRKCRTYKNNQKGDSKE